MSPTIGQPFNSEWQDDICPKCQAIGYWSIRHRMLAHGLSVEYLEVECGQCGWSYRMSPADREDDDT